MPKSPFLFPAMIFNPKQVTDRVELGLIFATFHFPESAANFLTNPALDPQVKIPEFKVCAVRVMAVSS